MNPEFTPPPAADASPDTIDVDSDVTESEALQQELARLAVH